MLLGVVLAGGASARFGRLKIAEKVLNKPVLRRVIEAFWSTNTIDKIMVVYTHHTLELIKTILNGKASDRIVLVRDFYQLPCGGPLRGVVSSLLYAASWEDIEGAVIVPGDAPWLEGSVIEAIVSASIGLNSDASTPVDGAGSLLPFFFIGKRAVAEVVGACYLRGSRARATDMLRVADRLLLLGSSLVAGDSPLALSTFNTLEELVTPVEVAPLKASIIVEGLGGSFREAYRREAHNDHVGAFHAYYMEYTGYKRIGLKVLEAHALRDTERVLPGHARLLARLDH